MKYAVEQCSTAIGVFGQNKRWTKNGLYVCEIDIHNRELHTEKAKIHAKFTLCLLIIDVVEE